MRLIGPGEASTTATSSSATTPISGRSTIRISRPCAPVFFEGELVAWVGASGHQLDTGGMDPGGFSIKAVDTHQEGLRMPPVKIVVARHGARGHARLDPNQVRDPLVGARREGPDRLAQQRPAARPRRCSSNGAGNRRRPPCGVDRLCAREARRAARASCRTGEWREVQYIDHDGHESQDLPDRLHADEDRRTAEVRLHGHQPERARPDQLHLCGAAGRVLTATYLNLCWDIPWNRGVRDCMDIVTRARHGQQLRLPGALRDGDDLGGHRDDRLRWRCLSQMVLASEQYRDQAMAVWSGTSMAPIFAGTSQHGFPFAATEMSHFGGGGGARTLRRRRRYGRHRVQHDAEHAEHRGPGSGVPGALSVPPASSGFRRARAIPRRAVGRACLHDVRRAERRTRGSVRRHRRRDAERDRHRRRACRAPRSASRASSTPTWRSASRTGRRCRTRLEIDRRATRNARAASTPARRWLAGDVWYHSWQAGGGYGDPLLRDPARRRGGCRPPRRVRPGGRATSTASSSRADGCAARGCYQGSSAGDSWRSHREVRRARRRRCARRDRSRQAPLRRCAHSRPRWRRNRMRPLRRDESARPARTCWRDCANWSRRSPTPARYGARITTKAASSFDNCAAAIAAGWSTYRWRSKASADRRCASRSARLERGT